jgi:hypothetical protein
MPTSSQDGTGDCPGHPEYEPASGFWHKPSLHRTNQCNFQQIASCTSLHFSIEPQGQAKQKLENILVYYQITFIIYRFLNSSIYLS